MIKYSLNDFNNINKNNISKIDQKILLIIESLSKKVGAVSYNKTPIFKKQWKQNFKKTILKKNEITVDQIITLLNKLTKNNYSIIKDEIIEKITEIIKKDETKKKMEEICIIIFNIASKNKFWCEIYAKLCSCLINKYPTMKGICQTNFDNLLDLFKNIKIVDPNEDYELFCKTNDENAKRKSICCFFVYLMKYNIIEEAKILYIINKLIDVFKKNINNEEFKNENFEICENLCILIKQSMDFINNKNELKNIKIFIEFVINLNIKEYDGVSSKTYFKFLDVFE